METMRRLLDGIWPTLEATADGQVARADLYAALASKGVLEAGSDVMRIVPPQQEGEAGGHSATYYTIESLKVQAYDDGPQEKLSRAAFYADFCLETQLLAFFHEMDPEGLGYLQKVCLRSMMSANIGLFKTTDPRDLDHVFDCLELDPDGKVDAYRFMQILGANHRVVSLFQKCDRAGDGVVSKAELAAVLATDEKAVALLAEANISVPTGAHAEFRLPHVAFEALDLNQTGNITLEEFMCRLHRVQPNTPRRSRPKKATPFTSLQPQEKYCANGDAAAVKLRGSQYSFKGQKTTSEPAFYDFLGMDLVQSAKLITKVAEKVELMEPSVAVPVGCPLPGIIVINMQVPRDEPSLFSQTLNGPTTNVIMYFGLRPQTVEMLQKPPAERSNALNLLCRYWTKFPEDRKLQETLKLICICHNIKELGGILNMFSSHNGKPVLVTRSGTVYRGQTSKGVSYGGVDINFRCWVYAARSALGKCVEMVPSMDIQAAFTIEGDHKKRGGEYESELPEQVFGTCLFKHIPNVLGNTITNEQDFFPGLRNPRGATKVAAGAPPP